MKILQKRKRSEESAAQKQNKNSSNKENISQSTGRDSAVKSKASVKAAQKKAEVLASVELEGSINNVPFGFMKQFNQPSTIISNIDSSINKYNLPSNVKDQETNLTKSQKLSVQVVRRRK